MTVHKEQYKQYLEQLDNLCTQVIFNNLKDFKAKLLSPDVSNVMEIYYSGKEVLVFCEFARRTTIYETIPLDDFVDWLFEVTNTDEDDGNDAA